MLFVILLMTLGDVSSGLASYRIERDALGSGGATSSSANYRLTDIAGQALPPGSSTNGTHTLTAGFSADTPGTFQFPLNVTRTGAGTGMVTSIPSGIDCGADCIEYYAQGTRITLMALPDADSAFYGWSGDCTGISTCEVTMDQARAVTVAFSVVNTDIDTDVDTDGDGMPDDWEQSTGLDPTSDDSAQDPDQDGLTNQEEFDRHSHPNNPDTDGDHLADGLDTAPGLDPLTENTGIYVALSNGDRLFLHAIEGGFLMDAASLSAANLPSTIPPPADADIEIVNVTMKTTVTGGAVRIVNTLETPLTETETVLVYTAQNGWSDPVAMGTATLNDSRDQITLDFMDGGDQDADGMTNGNAVIYYALWQPGNDDSSGGGSGCFIAAVTSGWNYPLAWGLLLICALGYFLVARSYVNQAVCHDHNQNS